MKVRRRWVRLPLALGSVAAVGAVFLLWQLLGMHLIAQEETSNLSRAKLLYDNVIREETTPFPVQKRLNLLLGSRAVDLSHYRPFDDGKFRCMVSGIEIAFEKVNDDFCDCPRDGSDEPGTSACSEAGRFFCTYHQRAGKTDVWVPSGRVNDGICDCCDGSDEWQNKTLNARFRLSESEQRRLGVYHVPCPFTCF